MRLPHIGVSSDFFIVVATGPTGPWYLQPFMKCHYHFFILWNWWHFRCCFSDVSSGTVGPDGLGEMTASSFVSDECCMAFYCHAEGLVLRKWNWLCVSEIANVGHVHQCDWWLCWSKLLLRINVLHISRIRVNNVMTCHMFVWPKDPYVLNILCIGKGQPLNISQIRYC